MTTSMKLQIRMSELREAVNDLAADDSAEATSKREALAGELKAKEAEFRAAVETESRGADGTPESREWAALTGPLRPGRDVHERDGASRRIRRHRGSPDRTRPGRERAPRRAVDGETRRHASARRRGAESRPDHRVCLPGQRRGIHRRTQPDSPGRRRHIPGTHVRPGGEHASRERPCHRDNRRVHGRRAHVRPRIQSAVFLVAGRSGENGRHV